MEDPVQYRRNCACIIRRFIKRVQARNRANDVLQNIIHSHGNPINDSTVILGTPTSRPTGHGPYGMDSNVWVYTHGGNGRYYAHDVRELYHMLRHGYAGACCPYTRRPFTRYEKYYAVRAYYHILAQGIPDIDLDSPHKETTTALADKLNRKLTPYNTINVHDISSDTWYTLLHELTLKDRYRMGMYVLLFNQAQYHYLQGNVQAFLSATWRLLIHWIDESPAPESTATEISMQLSPITSGLPLDLLGLIDMFPSTGTGVRMFIPVPRQAEEPAEGDRPAQRRRIDRSSA